MLSNQSARTTRGPGPGDRGGEGDAGVPESLAPPAGTGRLRGASVFGPPEAAATLRGVVDFQWRHGGKVLYSATRTTSAGHKSLAGAEPADYTAATCVIG